MDEANKLDSTCRELGLSSAASNQLQSGIKKYIEQWNHLALDVQMFDKLNDSDIEAHCSRYLDNGWDRNERVGNGTGKGKGKGSSKGAIVPPGRFFWESSLGHKRTKYEYPRDIENILNSIRKIFAILKRTQDASNSMHVESISARESKQANSRREIPSSPEICDSNNDPLDDDRAQNRAACRLTILTSREQPVPDDDDDDSYRPAPSELDSAEFVQGDTQFDVDTSDGCHQAPSSTVKGLERQTNVLPDKESIKQAVKPHPSTGEIRYRMGRGQKHRAYNEPEVSQILLHSPDPSTQASTAENADRLLMATGELDSEPTAKRPRNDRAMARNSAEPRKDKRGAQYHCSHETAHTQDHPASPSLSYDPKRPRSSTNTSPSDDRSQTLMPAPTEGYIGEQSPEHDSQSCEPEDPGLSGTPFTQPIDRRRETSFDLEVSQPLRLSRSVPSRSSRRMASPIGIPWMRVWILVREHPRKSWKNLPDLTFPSQSLESFYSSIKSQVNIGGCSSIEMTLSTADEDHIFSLPRNDEYHFEKMKAFVMQLSQFSQPARKGEPIALDMYMIP